MKKNTLYNVPLCDSFDTILVSTCLFRNLNILTGLGLRAGGKIKSKQRIRGKSARSKNPNRLSTKNTIERKQFMNMRCLEVIIILFGNNFIWKDKTMDKDIPASLQIVAQISFLANLSDCTDGFSLFMAKSCHLCGLPLL